MFPVPEHPPFPLRLRKVGLDEVDLPGIFLGGSCLQGPPADVPELSGAYRLLVVCRLKVVTLLASGTLGDTILPVTTLMRKQRAHRSVTF